MKLLKSLAVLGHDPHIESLIGILCHRPQLMGLHGSKYRD